MMIAFALISLVLAFWASPGRSDGSKEADRDVVRSEARVPVFELPPLLVTQDGRPIKTAEEWLHIRRPQVLALFGSLVYGNVPVPDSPIRTAVDVVHTDKQFLNGRATRKDVRIRFENDRGKAEMYVLIFTPNGAKGPSPAFLQLSFTNTRDNGYDPDPERPGLLRCGVPLGEMLQRGYGYVVVYQADLVHHNEVEFNGVIHSLFYHRGQSFPRASEWGVISAIAWSASRAMDYIQTDPDIDSKRVAIMGHSKCGKTALWAAAQDERFALAIAAQSGCGGASLFRRRYGETLEKMVTHLPYWLCRNAWKFVNNEDDLPVDQHMLIACIAPRPVYICSGVEDTWADPRGMYLAAYYAGDVYRLLGKKALESIEQPPLARAIIKSDVGYHIRPGGHSVELFDWERFLDFADYHFNRAAAASLR